MQNLSEQVYPLFVRLKNRNCLVAGGGEVAYRKARDLLSCGALVTVVAPLISRNMLKLRSEVAGRLTWHRRSFQSTDCKGKYLVVAATDRPEINRVISHVCEESQILVNSVDQPENCSYFSGAVVQRGNLKVAVSTGGTCPAFARYVRSSIDEFLPRDLGIRLAALAGLRRKFAGLFPEPAVKSGLWNQLLFGSGAPDYMFQNRRTVREALKSRSVKLAGSFAREGKVFLVGAGPGDPGLLTVKAKRILQMADTVLYDRIVSSEVLAVARKDAERIFVGKEKYAHAVSQCNINELLLRHARQGKLVARLKGGDPFLYGRGGEEAEFLSRHGIPWVVVPGVSAAQGCGASAGIPLTHRKISGSVLYLTGHCCRGKTPDEWQSLRSMNSTLIIYMGLSKIRTLTEILQEHGFSSGLPVALISEGTTPREKIIVSDLEHISRVADEARPRAPSLLIIGEVVALRGKLQDNKPHTAVRKSREELLSATGAGNPGIS